ncbi:phage tail protein [Vibrio parahaemolyticus]|nr:phage tail protein [Vibrio parahaemolyticus]
MSNEGLKLVITRRGLEAAISAAARGIKVALKWVSVGDADYIPNKEQSVLRNEIDRVEFGEYKDIGGSTIQAAAKFSGPKEYAIREIGFWLDDGTLFGVISSPGVLLNFKAKNAHCIQPFTLNLSDLPSDSVTVVVGTENLNILISEEMAMMARTQVDNMHLLIKQQFQLLAIEKKIALKRRMHSSFKIEALV